jgi:hypothetical protein
VPWVFGIDVRVRDTSLMRVTFGWLFALAGRGVSELHDAAAETIVLLDWPVADAIAVIPEKTHYV